MWQDRRITANMTSCRLLCDYMYSHLFKKRSSSPCSYCPHTTSRHLIWRLSLKPVGIFGARPQGLALIMLSCNARRRRMRCKVLVGEFRFREKSKEGLWVIWSARIFPHSFRTAHGTLNSSFIHVFFFIIGSLICHQPEKKKCTSTVLHRIIFQLQECYIKKKMCRQRRRCKKLCEQRWSARQTGNKCKCKEKGNKQTLLTSNRPQTSKT